MQRRQGGCSRTKHAAGLGPGRPALCPDMRHLCLEEQPRAVQTVSRMAQFSEIQNDGENITPETELHQSKVATNHCSPLIGKKFFFFSSFFLKCRLAIPLILWKTLGSPYLSNRFNVTVEEGKKRLWKAAACIQIPTSPFTHCVTLAVT